MAVVMEASPSARSVRRKDEPKRPCQLLRVWPRHRPSPSHLLRLQTVYDPPWLSGRERQDSLTRDVAEVEAELGEGKESLFDTTRETVGVSLVHINMRIGGVEPRTDGMSLPSLITPAM
jgi:hypothetical protein